MSEDAKNYPSRRALRQAQRDAQRARAEAPTTRTSRPVHPTTGLSEETTTTTTKPPARRGLFGRKPQRKPLSPKARRKRMWKRIGGTLAGLFLAGIIGVSALFIGAYVLMDIPRPDEAAQAEVTTVYYADGKTPMAQFADRNRTIIDTSKLPDYVGQAVVASEDRTFFENSGVDLRGIARALWNNIQGKPTQGGSTLSQQYVENYYLGANKTYWGKFKESILALKINRQQNKDEILNNYLNTIYYGRSAYGVEAAAHAYFNKSATDLTVSEAALLAGIIPAPNAWDPRVDPKSAEIRWNRVLDNMVADGWISAEERAKQQFPETIEHTQKSSDYTGSKGYLLTHVRSELVHSVGYTEDELDTMGLRIVTTIDPNKQKMAEEAVKKLPAHQENLRVGLVSVDTATGGIVAEYGGADYEKIQRSAAFQDQAQAGSTFKPFALVAAFEQGLSPSSTISGAAPLNVNGKAVKNVDHSYGMVTLADAAKYSVNTAFVRLSQKVSQDAVRQVAMDAGYPSSTPGLDAQTPVAVLGTASPRCLDIADAYTTFATGGIRRPAHIVAKVMDSSGSVLYQADTTGTRVFDAGVVSELNHVLQGVVNGGTAKKVSGLGRPIAAKTGSSENLKSAQFVGYIPQMVTSVSMYQVGEDGSEQTIAGFGGVRDIFGGTWPAQVWRWYMAKAMSDLDVEEFPDVSVANKKAAPKYKDPQYSTPSIPTPRPKASYPTVAPRLPEIVEEESSEPEPSDDASDELRDDESRRSPQER